MPDFAGRFAAPVPAADLTGPKAAGAMLGLRLGPGLGTNAVVLAAVTAVQ
jgi:hypothetical protein